jgi:hypothetical protein
MVFLRLSSSRVCTSATHNVTNTWCLWVTRGPGENWEFIIVIFRMLLLKAVGFKWMCFCLGISRRS